MCPILSVHFLKGNKNSRLAARTMANICGNRYAVCSEKWSIYGCKHFEQHNPMWIHWQCQYGWVIKSIIKYAMKSVIHSQTLEMCPRFYKVFLVSFCSIFPPLAEINTRSCPTKLGYAGLVWVYWVHFHIIADNYKSHSAILVHLIKNNYVRGFATINWLKHVLCVDFAWFFL